MKTSTVLLVAAAALGAVVVIARGGLKGGGRVAGIVNGAARAVGIPAYSDSPDLYVESGNEGMSRAAQYAAYGQGQAVARVYADAGMSAPDGGVGLPSTWGNEARR